MEGNVLFHDTLNTFIWHQTYGKGPLSVRGNPLPPHLIYMYGYTGNRFSWLANKTGNPSVYLFIFNFLKTYFILKNLTILTSHFQYFQYQKVPGMFYKSNTFGQ